MTPTDLTPELRSLIDARLETIDTVLQQAQVSWTERRSIVGEVETQIYELLSRRTSMPREEDVLAVLGSLDPPEAYIPEESRGQTTDVPIKKPAPRWAWFDAPRYVRELVARYAPGVVCAGTLVAANGIVIVIIASSEGLIPWLVTLGGLAWVNYAGVRRFRAWAATRSGNLFTDLRHSLSLWLMPKNETQTT